LVNNSFGDRRLHYFITILTILPNYVRSTNTLDILIDPIMIEDRGINPVALYGFQGGETSRIVSRGITGVIACMVVSSTFLVLVSP
jgi:hypothetical protein